MCIVCGCVGGCMYVSVGLFICGRFPTLFRVCSRYNKVLLDDREMLMITSTFHIEGDLEKKFSFCRETAKMKCRKPSKIAKKTGSAQTLYY